MFSFGVDHPRLSVVAVLLLVVASLLLLPRAKFDPTPERVYPADSPRAQFAAEHRERFGREDDVLFAVREGDPFDDALEQVARILEEDPAVSGVVSPARFSLLGQDETGALSARPLAPGEHHPLVDGTLIALDGGAGALAISLRASHNNHPDRVALLSDLERITEAAGGRWHLSGMPMVRIGYVEMMGRDLRTVVPLAVAVASVFFWLTFRDWRHVLLGVLSVGSGALIAAGASIASGAPFDIFATAFITIVLVVGTSDLVHLVHRFSDHFARTGDRVASARQAAAEIGAACLLTSATTTVGFLALLSTNIPPIRQFGAATGVGVMITFLVCFAVVPPVLARIGPPHAAALSHAAGGAARMARLSGWTMRHWRALLAVQAGVVVVCALLAGRLRVDYRLLQHLEASYRHGEAHTFLEERMGGVLPIEVAVALPGDGTDPAVLAAVDELATWTRDHEAIGHAAGLTDILIPSWEALSGQTGLPPDAAAVAQTLLMVELASPELVETFLVQDADGSWHTRITARIHDGGHEPTLRFVRELSALADARLAPLGATVTVTGIAWLVQEVNLTLTEQFASSFAIALAVIGLLWLVGTRSLRRTALALVPNLVPLLMVLGLMGAVGIALKPSTAMVLSIGLGIAVDDTIHFLSAYERRRREGGTLQAAITHAFETAGRSMLDTSVMITLGFSCLLLAGSPENQNFGLLASWVVVCAVQADLLLLAPLLRWLDRR